MPSSDYNKYLAAIKAANDMENKELLRQIKNELIANYGLMDDDVDYLLRQFRYNVSTDRGAPAAGRGTPFVWTLRAAHAIEFGTSLRDKGWMGMGTTLSTLSNLAIYIGLVVVGAFLGSRKALRSRPLAWVGKLQFAALMILIVTLGINLGANDEVVSSLGQIGLAALVITVLAMAGSLLCLTLLRRFVLKLDHYGLPRGSEAAREEEAHHGGKADNSLTFLIVIAVVLGMLAGRFVLPAAVTAHCGTVISFGLYLLLFMVGMDMGKQGTLLADIKTAGFQVLLVPVAVCAGSLAFAALAGLFLPLGVKDSMAAASGLGWYSLAPTLLAPYSLSVSAVAFLSNVMREIFAIITIPIVAKYVGYVECASLPGAAAMDTVLPVVVGATHERITIYSFTSGVVLSLAVPLLVPAIVALPF